MRTPRWLVACTVGVISTTAALSIGWWGACTFYIGPQMWADYIRTEGKLANFEPKVCEDADSRAIQVLTSLLATLLGLMSNLPTEGE